MAPKRTSLRPNSRNRATFVNAVWSRAWESKSGPLSLRRLKNGLLDVTRMSGAHLDAITTNSNTPLLQLPPELRNHIWEYAPGGRVLDVIFVETLRGRYMEEKTPIALDTCPLGSHALLQQKLIAEVHVITHRAERMLGRMNTADCGSPMPRAFPIEVFPNVKKVVIEVGYSFRYSFSTVDMFDEEKQDRLVEENINTITKYFKEAKPGVKLVFEHVNHCTEIAEDSELDGEDSE
ncbi:beta transducin [Ascochyta clinopodiicola]|nr:beta transducin [Ascochyta clinopodiicola]